MGAPITASSFAGPATRERPQVQGRNQYEFNDEIPFAGVVVTLLEFQARLFDKAGLLCH